MLVEKATLLIYPSNRELRVGKLECKVPCAASPISVGKAHFKNENFSCSSRFCPDWVLNFCFCSIMRHTLFPLPV